MPVLSDNQQAAPVAALPEKKAKKSPAAPIIHDWPFHEDLTETEGQLLDAARKWARAENDPAYRARLIALDLVVIGLYEAKNGGERWQAFAVDTPLSTAEVAAFEVVVGFWKRHTKRNKKNAKRWAKRQATEGAV